MEGTTKLAVSVSDLAPAFGSLNQAEWNQIVLSMELSPQQARIVELIMDSKPDKHIARELKVSVPTVRTYLTRIFQRTGATDRVGLPMRVFACAQQLRRQEGGERK